MPIGLDMIEDCPHCEQHSSIVNMECYGCAVRYGARLVKPSRLRLYYAIAQRYDKATQERFAADVAQYRKEREAAGAII